MWHLFFSSCEFPVILHLPCNYEHGRNKKRNDRRQVLFDDIFSMGTRTITVIEATRQTTPKLSFLSISAGKKSSTSYVIIRKKIISARSCVAAGPTRSGIAGLLHRWRLRRLLAFHTLVGYCWSLGCVGCVVG